jgi:hypothetical protein
MSLDEPRSLGAPQRPPPRPPRARPVLVRLAVLAGCLGLCATGAALASLATTRDEALALAWAATAGVVTGLCALSLRDRRRAERRGRFEEWWTQVSERQGFASAEDLDT